MLTATNPADSGMQPALGALVLFSVLESRNQGGVSPQDLSQQQSCSVEGAEYGGIACPALPSFLPLPSPLAKTAPDRQIRPSKKFIFLGTPPTVSFSRSPSSPKIDVLKKVGILQPLKSGGPVFFWLLGPLLLS